MIKMNREVLNKAISKGLHNKRDLLDIIGDDILIGEILNKLRGSVYKELKKVV